MNEDNKTNEEEKKETEEEKITETNAQEENEAKQEETKQEAASAEEMNELNDRYKRLFAEFENYKKRTQKESLTKRADITADVVTSILPVVDNLEKAVEMKIENTAYQDGIKMILKQLK